jgi:hypothetical protein
MKNVGLVASALTIGLALAACASSAPAGEEATEDLAQAASSNACRWRCGHCPKDRLCKLACTPIGNCGTACNTLMLCVEGYVFDETACRCVPSGGNTGEPCGGGTCAAGDVCCNASCGICTPPGGMCTMQVCTAL